MGSRVLIMSDMALNQSFTLQASKETLKPTLSVVAVRDYGSVDVRGK